MNELIKNENIENMIYEIRGMQVMLDSDLARIYQVETKQLNRQVKRNIERFPEDFCFQLKESEYKDILRCQNGTLELKQGQYSKYLPYVFTEYGVAALSGILRSEKAIEANKRIIRAFVKMRHLLINNQNVLPNRLLLLEDKVDSNTKRIDELFNKFNNDVKNQYTFYKGAFYDTYSLFLDILFKGVNEIIIIDNYAGHKLLDMIKNINTNIIIISKNIDNKLKEKYEEQYHNVTFIYNNTIHDRYIILDRKRLFHSGMSFKDLGKSTFSITEFDDKDEINNFIKSLKININI